MVEYFIQTLSQGSTKPEITYRQREQQKSVLMNYFQKTQDRTSLENFLFFCAKEKISPDILSSQGDKVYELIEDALLHKDFANIKKIFDSGYPNTSTQQNILILHIIKNRLSLYNIQEMEQVFGSINIPPSYRTFLERQ